MNKNLITGWFLYVYESSFAEKQFNDPNVKYGKVLTQIDRANKKIRNLQQVFYDYDEQLITSNNKIEAWTHIVPGTSGVIVYNALVEYATKFPDTVDKHTKS